MESSQPSGSVRLHSDDEAVATHHESEQQGSSQPTGSTTTKTKRRTRGLTRMKNLSLTEGTAAPQRLPVTFDADLNPEGDNGAKLISYIGATARSKISILSNDWRLVDDKLKDQIWEEILLTFDIPPTDEIKKMVKKRAGDRWRDFKTKLTRDYIRRSKKGGNPMEEYPFISDEVWENFKKSREDPKFLKLSEANKERQRRNVYPHYMARSGYKGLEKAMMAEQLKAAEASSTFDPAVGAPSLEHPSRELKWKAARVKKGKYITPESAEVAQRIDSLHEQRSEGSFTPCGRMDILATALGKPDHPGRVVGVGKGVGLRQYFGATSRTSSESMLSKEEFDVRLKEETEKVEARLEQKHEQEIQKLRAEFMDQLEELKRSFVVPQAPEPSMVERDPGHSPEKGVPCVLYLEEPTMRAVADGYVFPFSSTIHHDQIRPDQVRVTVDKVRSGETDAPVPFPSEEVLTVGQAKGTFIPWPKKLVQTGDKMLVKSDKKDIPQLPLLDPAVAAKWPSIAMIWDMWPSLELPINLQMPQGVVGSDISYHFAVDRKDLSEFLLMQELGNAFMDLAILLCHHEIRSAGLGDRFSRV